MNQRHKQRMIGAVVIVALAVIFLPMLLRGPVEHASQDVPMVIPARPPAPISGQPAAEPESPPPPALDGVPIRSPAPIALASPPEPVAEPEVVPAPPSTAAEPEPEPEPAPDQGPEREVTPHLESYAVQVGSFRSRDNAMGLRNRLRGKGFAAFLDETAAGGSPIFRLRVGPVAGREQAQELAREIRQATDIEGMVIAHP